MWSNGESGATEHMRVLRIPDSVIRDGRSTGRHGSRSDESLPGSGWVAVPTVGVAVYGARALMTALLVLVALLATASAQVVAIPSAKPEIVSLRLSVAGDQEVVPATRVGGPAERSGAPVEVDLQMRLKDVQVTATPKGDVVRIETEGGVVELSPEQYVRAIGATKARVEHGGFFYKLFNISKPMGFLWISVGFLGQAMFTFRMVLQWWASEKHKRSVVPVGFWWGSLIGGVMLFAYFVWRKDVVGIVGQSTGVFVYARNLVLIYRGRRIEAEGARTLAEGEPTPKPG